MRRSDRPLRAALDKRAERVTANQDASAAPRGLRVAQEASGAPSPDALVRDARIARCNLDREPRRSVVNVRRVLVGSHGKGRSTGAPCERQGYKCGKPLLYLVKQWRKPNEKMRAKRIECSCYRYGSGASRNQAADTTTPARAVAGAGGEEREASL